MNIISQEIVNGNIHMLHEQYASGLPFPNIQLPDFLNQSFVKKLQSDFPTVTDKNWTHYIHYNERKHGLNKWAYLPLSAQNLITEMSQPAFISWLEQLTGIPNLLADSSLEGSGLHQTLPGGFLNIHADFTVHPRQKNWQRRVNVLIYLNEDWDEKWQGNLELWDEEMHKCIKSIPPTFNTAVIFSTGKKTYHGSPNPLSCPKGTSRKSIALYYYTLEKKPAKSATNYQARPNDGYKKTLIWLDKKLISVYSFLKGKLGLSDRLVSSILNSFSNKKSK